MKKTIFLFLSILVSISLSACSSGKSIDKLSYQNVKSEKSSSGITYITVKTKVKSTKNLKEIAKKVFKKNKKSDSVFLRITKPDNSIVLANAKIANTQKGMKQTGLSKTDAMQFTTQKITKKPNQQGNGITAMDVVNGFKKAGLSVPNKRDNSSNCSGSQGLGCIQIISTDTVTVYEWKDLQQAKKMKKKGGSLFDYQEGRITLKFWKKNKKDYENVLDYLVNN